MYTKPLTPVPLLDLFAACATVTTGQPHVRGTINDVLTMIATPEFPGGLLTDGVHPWDHALEAFTTPSKHAIARP